MTKYDEFVQKLVGHVENYDTNPTQEWEQQALHYINGVATSELRRLVSLEERRANGAFFTENDLAIRVLRNHKLNITENPIFYDPACGAANLLLGAKEVYFEALCSKNLTFELLGTDIHKQFIEASQTRLEISHLLSKGNSRQYFSSDFAVCDGTINNEFYQKATHILVNPPFNLMNSSKSYSWTSGKVSAAAIFMDRIIEYAREGTMIIAILPEVLRCGSRYKKWRDHIEATCKIISHKQLGQFDRYADIDVFSILLQKKGTSKKRKKYNWVKKDINENTVDTMFDVCVGPVVDNRDPVEGPNRPYLKSRGLMGWAEIKSCATYRSHLGRDFKSPFVVIKRTSRAGEAHRATATLINISEPTFVDNHLIVLQPKSGKLSDCRRLIKVLQEQRTTDWIDSQICCRHLTVKIVSKIPL